MKKRNLGKSGLQVSEIGLGCNAFGGRIDLEASRKVVHAALDLGITLFDTSDMYGDDYGSPGGSEICLGLLPYFPLAAGLLTGKYQRDVPFPADARLRHNKRWANQFLTDRNWTQLGRLEIFCAARGCSLLELAFGWLLARPAVASVIAGATKPGQLQLNVESAAWLPAGEDMAEIDRCSNW